MKHSRILAAALAAAMTMLCGCSAAAEKTETTAAAETAAETVSAAQAIPMAADAQTASNDSTSESTEEDAYFSDRDLDPSYKESEAVTITLSDGASTSDGAVQITGDTITILQKGVYILTGTLSNGQIIVNVPDTDKVQLVLSGASVTAANRPAVLVQSADKVFLTLADGTENVLSATGAPEENDLGADGAVFSECDLTVNGTGSLTVTADACHGLVTRDDLRITGGTITVSAASRGLDANDSIGIGGGSITVTSGTDALHAEDEDPTAGTIYISGCELTVTSTGDGLDASGDILIEDGTLTLTCGGGSANAPAHTSSMSGGRGGWGADASTTASASDDSTSAKGIKCDGTLTVTGGSITADCADDAIHGNADAIISGGTLTLASGDDGLHADANLTLSGGNITVSQSYEGIEAAVITVYDGNISVTSDDDGFNASSGDQSGTLDISGGTIYVNAQGDGLDTNGSMTISGGVISVDGPSVTGNSPLDYNGTCTVSGGTLLGCGVGNMVQGPGSTSTQGCITAALGSSQAAGTTFTLTDANGTVIAEHTPAKSYQAVVISCDAITADGTYTLTAGSSSQTIQMSGLVYGSTASGMSGGHSGHGRF